MAYFSFKSFLYKASLLMSFFLLKFGFLCWENCGHEDYKFLGKKQISESSVINSPVVKKQLQSLYVQIIHRLFSFNLYLKLKVME